MSGWIKSARSSRKYSPCHINLPLICDRWNQATGKEVKEVTIGKKISRHQYEPISLNVTTLSIKLYFELVALLFAEWDSQYICHMPRSSLRTGITIEINKVEFRNRAGVAQRVPGGLGSQISWHSACEGGEVVSLTHRPPLPPGMLLVLIFTRGWVDPRAMVRSEGNMSLKNPVTPPGIDRGTVRLVEKRLNQYATPGPKII
jgi:hypothetical protein